MSKNNPEIKKSYQLLLKQLEAMTEDETDAIANYANASALLYHSLHEVNWAGFYFAKEGELVLGPFQDFLPVCAFRSAEAYAALPTLTATCSGLPM